MKIPTYILIVIIIIGGAFFVGTAIDAWIKQDCGTWKEQGRITISTVEICKGVGINLEDELPKTWQFTNTKTIATCNEKGELEIIDPTIKVTEGMILKCKEVGMEL